MQNDKQDNGGKGIPLWAQPGDAGEPAVATTLPTPRVKGLTAVRDAMLDKVANPAVEGIARITEHLKPAPAVALTAERGTTHGDFDDNAALSQMLKDTIRGFQRKDGSYPWHYFTPAMKDSLDMLCTKIGRIGAGRPDFRDHWADIAGYAQLIADRCPD